MTQQSGRYGYKPNERNGMSEQVVDKTKELAEEALDRADEWLKPTGLSIKERPMTVLAVVGGLAFAAGAFWMLKNSRQQSRYDELVATLTDLPRRAGWRSALSSARLIARSNRSLADDVFGSRFSADLRG